MPAQLGRYQPPRREMGGRGAPTHSGGIVGWDPTTGCSGNHLRAAWAGINVIRRWHGCKDMAEWLGYRCNIGCWCPQRHSCSWECPSHDQLQVLPPQATAAGLGQQKGEQPTPGRMHVPMPASLSSRRWAQGRAQTPGVVLCDGRGKQGLCSTA